MKHTPEKDRHFEIYSIVFSVILAAVICIGGFSDNIAFAVASVMFYSDTTVPVYKSDITVTDTPQTEDSSDADAIETVKIRDITRTSDDITALIQKYTELFKKDKKDGEIRSITYEKSGATHIFENVRVKNTTATKTLNIEKVLSEPLEISIDKSKPAVLIFHSHTSEGYEMIERDWYAQDYTSRSNDESRNIVRVGTEIANYLEELGYTVIHDKTIHDNSYSDSYPTSRKTVEKHLEEHPEIQSLRITELK